MKRLAAIPGVALVAIAAAMWGTDPIIRKPLSGSTSATTIVFGEHVVLVLLTLPLLVPALRAVWRAGWRYLICAVVIGAGASAVTSCSSHRSTSAELSGSSQIHSLGTRPLPQVGLRSRNSGRAVTSNRTGA